jgi:parallel beta-helix repeat protein
MRYIKPALLVALVHFPVIALSQGVSWNNVTSTSLSGRSSIETYDSAGSPIAITESSGNTIYLGATGRAPIIYAKGVDVAPSHVVTPTNSPRTIHVPADQTTIQAAINAASNGDTVFVTDGHYVENINFNGKSVVVKSVHGASKTTIDGGGLNTVVRFSTQEGAGSVLNGFTITNGYSQFDGAGIFIGGASPTITNNIITGNSGCWGIGIVVHAGGPLIKRNTISNNVMSGCSGGTGGAGIGVLASPSGIPTRIINNVIAGNNAGSSIGGGGISLWSAGSPIIENNIIENNDGGPGGGGLAMWNDSSPLIIQNQFIGNTALQGGGIYWTIPVSAPGMLLLDNTFSQNLSPSGSAIFDGGFDDNMKIENNLIIGFAGQYAYFCEQSSGNTMPADFSHNDLFANGASAIGGNCAISVGNNGNVSVDPEFISASNTHLQAGSLAINAGTKSAPSLPSTDLDGFKRIVGGAIDIGTYEFFPSNVSIKPNQLAFTAQSVGTKSGSKTVVVSNTATVPLFVGVSVDGDFQLQSSCPGRLAAASACMVKVYYVPKTKGPQIGHLSIRDNALGSPQVVPLGGTGR